ncbi:copper resistance protein NlpE [Algoriphagus sp.]|uniref:copper resistance protein NlpE n=1 Tax=Algoriphagus sp. TaxID=1872435 RepID=UPI00328229A1
MKSLLTLLAICASLSLITSCSNSPENTDTQAEVTSEEKITEKTPLYKGDNSATSLDWNGSYKGTVPCASCEGIETVLTLNQDMTFKLSTHYLGRNDALEEDVMGNFKWDDTGSIAILENVKNRPNQFKVGENKIWQLDMNGERVTGDLADHYILTKQ